MDKRGAHEPDAKSLTGEATPSALPGSLVHALDWLRGHLSEPVNLELLASVAGVRPRTLENHFKTFLGTTPLGWLRRTRFANARRELESGRADATVTRIALANGFNQLGRFAVEYRLIFGEAPSATLRRSRFLSPGSEENVDDEAFRITWQAIHEMGTARMGKDPKESVLNKWNQMHAVKNVFVTDGSFMCSTACQNPSLTFMAMTARACDYAVKEMKKMNI